ncbi:MAG: GH36-type glycosyl hydrolase domain-containing protein, partial [Planctomycetota bacterium]
MTGNEDLSTTFTFDDEARAIRIHRHDTPQPWINYLSNGRFHAFASQAGGGFAWWQSPIVFRLTRYRQNNLPIDSPGFYIYIRTEDGTVWSPTFRPCETPLDHWEACHQPGKTTYTAGKDGLAARLTLFVAPDHDVLVWDLELTNEAGEAVTCDVFAYVEHSQLGWRNESTYGYYVKLQLKTFFDENLQAANYLFHHCDSVRIDEVPIVYLASDGALESHSGSRNDFVGNYRCERNPIAVERGACGNEEIGCGEPASAVHRKVSIGVGESLRVPFFLGVSPGALVDLEGAQARQGETLSALRAPGAIDEQLAKLDTWWEEQFDAFQCEIPDEAAARQINTWNVVNSVQTGRYSRSVNAVAPGVRGIGYRDSSQDMLAIAYRRPSWALEMLKLLLSYQFESGRAVHMAFPEEGDPPSATEHSDDHLWPPLVAYAILAETGDDSMLDERVPYLSEEGTGAGNDGSIWEHLMASIRYTEANLGRHGLPLTMESDWNDIIGRFNQRGEGETVFAGQQYALVLRQMM